MNMKEFIGALKGLRGWRATTKGCIRLATGDYPNKEFCPITAVCYDRTGIAYETGKYKLAARKLDMPVKLTSHIAFASDDDPFHFLTAHKLRSALKGNTNVDIFNTGV